MTARALCLLVGLSLGCNLVLGLDEPTQRRHDGGGGGGGGGGGDPSGGSGGDGPGASGAGGATGGAAPGGGGAGGSCGHEDPITGTELLLNGGFEAGTAGWSTTPGTVAAAPQEEAFCGCAAGHWTASSGYQELRYLDVPDTQAGNVHAHARVKAPDSLAIELQVRVGGINLEAPAPFKPDAADGAVDGWRIADADYLVRFAGMSSYVALALDPSDPTTDLWVDCVSLTFSP